MEPAHITTLTFDSDRHRFRNADAPIWYIWTFLTPPIIQFRLTLAILNLPIIFSHLCSSPPARWLGVRFDCSCNPISAQSQHFRKLGTVGLIAAAGMGWPTVSGAGRRSCK